MNQKSYAKLVEWKDHQLIDERDKNRCRASCRSKRKPTWTLMNRRVGWLEVRAAHFGRCAVLCDRRCLSSKFLGRWRRRDNAPSLPWR